MFFKKDYWNKIGSIIPKVYQKWQDYNNADDELLSELYCKYENKYIAIDLSNPFCHLFFFSQREENKNLIPLILKTYQTFLQHPFCIAIETNKENENEKRIKDLENKINITLGKKIKKNSVNKSIIRNLISQKMAKKIYSLLPKKIKKFLIKKIISD